MPGAEPGRGHAPHRMDLSQDPEKTNLSPTASTRTLSSCPSSVRRHSRLTLSHTCGWMGCQGDQESRSGIRGLRSAAHAHGEPADVNPCCFLPPSPLQGPQQCICTVTASLTEACGSAVGYVEHLPGRRSLITNIVTADDKKVLTIQTVLGFCWRVYACKEPLQEIIKACRALEAARERGEGSARARLDGGVVGAGEDARGRRGERAHRAAVPRQRRQARQAVHVPHPHLHPAAPARSHP